MIKYKTILFIRQNRLIYGYLYAYKYSINGWKNDYCKKKNYCGPLQ